MDLSDLVLTAKVNLALARDPRVGVLDIGVAVSQGTVTLDGDVDSEEERAAALEIARGVDGVRRVRSRITCGVGKAADSAEHAVQKFLEKLDDGWQNLPDDTATTQAGYLQWALWLVYKFRVPEGLGGEEHARIEADATEAAFARISGYLAIPKPLLVLEMARQAESVPLVARPPQPLAAGEAKA